MAPYSCFFFLGFFGCFLVTIPFLSRVTRTAEKETSLAPSSVLFRFSPALFLPSEACCFSLEPGQCPKYEGQFDFFAARRQQDHAQQAYQQRAPKYRCHSRRGIPKNKHTRIEGLEMSDFPDYLTKEIFSRSYTTRFGRSPKSANPNGENLFLFLSIL